MVGLVETGYSEAQVVIWKQDEIILRMNVVAARHLQLSENDGRICRIDTVAADRCKRG